MFVKRLVLVVFAITVVSMLGVVTPEPFAQEVGSVVLD